VLDAVPGTGRVRERLARAADVVPLTARGALLALACALGLEFALREGDRVVLVLAASGLGLVLLSSGAVLLGAWRVRARLARPAAAPRRLSLEVGRNAPGGLVLPRLRGLLLVGACSEWLAPGEVACGLRARGAGLEEWIRPARRFETGRVLRRVSVEDAFGLAALAWEHERAQLISALPAAGGSSAPPAGRGAGDDEALAAGLALGDRFDTGPYQPGEPSRHILWRSWARSRELFVRTPERSASVARRVAAYLVCGPDDEPAAGAARAALESGALGGDWLLGADGCAGEARQLDQALSLLARSGGARGATRIAGFAARLAAEPETALLIFAPARTGAWVDEVERALRARAGEGAIVLALDPAPAPRARWPWQRRKTPAPDPIESLRARLAGVARVAVAERSAGASAARAALAGPGWPA
jgi:hypothetical protein